MKQHSTNSLLHLNPDAGIIGGLKCCEGNVYAVKVGRMNMLGAARYALQANSPTLIQLCRVPHAKLRGHGLEEYLGRMRSKLR